MRKERALTNGNGKEPYSSALSQQKDFNGCSRVERV
jgi:hypothetical protein